MKLRARIHLLLVAALLGCSSGDTLGPSGTVTVRLTDTPFADARAVLVTFSEVSAHRSGNGGFDRILFVDNGNTRTCDLKRLVAATDVLGTGPLAEGHYTQIRLTVASATLYWEAASSGPVCATTVAAPSGRSSPVEVPSGEAKLNREFDVGAGGATTITLDFDGDQSIRETGNNRFMMTPVITVVSVQ